MSIQLFENNSSLSRFNESFNQLKTTQEFLKDRERVIFCIICVLRSGPMDKESGSGEEMQNSVVAVITNQNGQNPQQIRLPLGQELPKISPSDYLDFTINNENKDKNRRILVPTNGIIKIGGTFTSDDTTGKTPIDTINRGVNNDAAQGFLGFAGGVVNATSWIGRKFLENVTEDKYEPSVVERFSSSDAQKAENEIRSMYNPNLARQEMLEGTVKMEVSNPKFPQNSFGFYVENNESGKVIANIQQEENRTGSRVLDL